MRRIAALTLVSTLSLITPTALGRDTEDSGQQSPYNTVQAQSQVQSGEAAPAYVEFPYPIDVNSAEKLAVRIPSTPVLGFVFSQDTVYGEFFPTEDYTYAEFNGDFESYYGTRAEITALITIEPSPGGSSVRGGGQPIATTSTDAVLDAFEGLPRFDSLPIEKQGPFDIQIEAAKAAAEAAGAIEPKFSAFANGGSDWPGSYVDLYAMNIDNSRAIGAWIAWQAGTGRSPHNMPDDWGLEFDSYTRDGGAAGIRPACLSGWGFWQSGNVEQWSINLLSGGTAKDTQPYLDTATVSDDCRIRDTTVGLGAPKNIGVQSDGAAHLSTMIQTTKGDYNHNPAGFYFQAVSHDCVGGAASWCMGINTGRNFPLGSAGRPVFSWDSTPKREFPGCYRWMLPNDPYPINCETGE